jgi:hypothetical protein
MTGWLIATIERLAPGARRLVVGAVAVLLLAVAITALTLQAGSGGGARRSTTASPARSHQTSTGTVPRSVRPPVSATALRRAAGVAGRFLVTYLRFAYGRAGAASVRAITRGLRSRLIRERARVTPAERRLHPRVVSLRVVGMTPGFALATASVEDGGIAAFPLRFTLQERDDSWSVSDVQEG